MRSLFLFVGGMIVGGGLGLWASASVKAEIQKLHAKADAILAALKKRLP